MDNAAHSSEYNGAPESGAQTFQGQPQAYSYNAAQGGAVQQVPGGATVITQPGAPGMAPGAVQHMVRPAPIPGVPPGLEYLSQIDQLLVHQQVELIELVTDWEARNRYQVKNSLGQQVYFASEESGICMRQCCGASRGFIMHITDNLGQEVIRVQREFKCCAGWSCCAFSDCCAMELTIEAPPGQRVGSVKQLFSCWDPKFDVFDADGQKVFGIVGPCCQCQGVCCRADIEFKVLNTANQQVGRLCKQWGGVLREMFTKADNFAVSFPVDLDVRMKAVLLGTVFLIDFMFFEDKHDKNKNNN